MANTRGKTCPTPGLTRRELLKGTAAVAALAAGGFAVPKIARAESKSLVVYSTTVIPVQKKLEAAFTAKTGISVQSIRLINNPLAQRFLTEQKAGQHLCDVITLGLEDFFHDLTKQDLIADLSGTAGLDHITGQWRPGERFVNISMAPQTICYNTKKLTGTATPSSWADLAKPQFKGQIIAADPRANDTGAAFFVMLYEALGEDYIRKIGQGLQLAPTMQPAVEQVVAGGVSLTLPSLDMMLLQYEGTNAPIASIPAPSPTQAQNFFSGIAKNAPNPEAARKWFEFTLSEEGQGILNRGIGVSPLGNIPKTLALPGKVLPVDTKSAMAKADKVFDLLGLPA